MVVERLFPLEAFECLIENHCNCVHDRFLGAKLRKVIQLTCNDSLAMLKGMYDLYNTPAELLYEGMQEVRTKTQTASLVADTRRYR
jgi:hypothetical protein